MQLEVNHGGASQGARPAGQGPPEDIEPAPALSSAWCATHPKSLLQGHSKVLIKRLKAWLLSTDWLSQ